MTTIRLILGLALLSLCVFGLPEGCLVFASQMLSSSHILINETSGQSIPQQRIDRG